MSTTFLERQLSRSTSMVGYGVGNGFEKLKELSPKSKVTDFRINGGIERDGKYLVIKRSKRS